MTIVGSTSDSDSASDAIGVNVARGDGSVSGYTTGFFVRLVSMGAGLPFVAVLSNGEEAESRGFRRGGNGTILLRR